MAGRRKPVSDLQELNNLPVLALPPVRQHKHEHEVDAYQIPAGSVTTKFREFGPKESRPKSHMTQADLAQREEVKLEQKRLAYRYYAYTDLLNAGLNRLEALAKIFDLSLEDVYERHLELHEEVLRGMQYSDIAKALERYDLDQNARLAILNKHAYSNNPGASLKAVDMAQDMDSASDQLGSFEEFLRMAKQRREA